MVLVASLIVDYTVASQIVDFTKGKGRPIHQKANIWDATSTGQFNVVTSPTRD